MMRLEVGKSYDRADGEEVTIIYETKHPKQFCQFRFIGIIDTYDNFKVDYYANDGESYKQFLTGGKLIR